MGGDVSRRGFEKFKTTLTLKKSQTWWDSDWILTFTLVCVQVCYVCICACGVRSCLQQAAWCHSWRAQPPETSYTHTPQHHHTSLVKQDYKLMLAVAAERYHLVMFSPPTFKVKLRTHLHHLWLFCKHCFFECLLFRKIARSTDTWVKCVCLCVCFPIHLYFYFCICKPICPSIRLCVCVFICPSSWPTPGRLTAVSAL